MTDIHERRVNNIKFRVELGKSVARETTRKAYGDQCLEGVSSVTTGSGRFQKRSMMILVYRTSVYDSIPSEVFVEFSIRIPFDFNKT